MARQKQERITLNIRPSADVMLRFESYCKEAGQTKTLAFERIVTAFLDQHEQEKKMLESLKISHSKRK